jgi:Flp pilus assembly protein TadD
MRIALAGRRRWWPAVLACYGAALLSKEHAVVFLPLLMAAGAFAAGSASAAWRRDRALYALVLATTACWLLLRRGVLQPGFAPLLIYAADNPLHGAAFPVRALTAVKVNLLYLANLVLPLRLQSVYSGPGLNTVVGPSTWWNLAALAYAAGCAAATLHGWRRREAWGFGVPAYLIGFAVTANLFVPITVLMADRFAYLPSAGFCLCAAGVLLLPARRARSPLAGRVLLLLPVAYVVLLAGLTLGRNAVFQQPGEFWRSVVRTDPGNVRGWFFLAQSAAEAGRAAEADHALAEAIRADPSLPDVHIARSLLLLEQGRAAEAADAARTAMQKAPAGVGLAQYALAEAELALGRPAAALPLLEEVAAMFSEAPGWWAARGRALEALDRAPEAAESYRRSLELADDTELRRRLAGLLVRIGRRGDAADVLQPGVPPTP